jgi:hypothetical protein
MKAARPRAAGQREGAPAPYCSGVAPRSAAALLLPLEKLTHVRFFSENNSRRIAISNIDYLSCANWLGTEIWTNLRAHVLANWRTRLGKPQTANRLFPPLLNES